MNTPVSFELAKLLKEKGFDEPCSAYYVPEVHDKICYQEYGGEFFNMNKIHTFHGKECVSAPTIADVVMWLYEKHGVWIQIISKNTAVKMCFKYEIKRFEWDGCITDDNLYNSPTEAYEAAIEYCLNNLI